jgi:hypothetical protein
VIIWTGYGEQHLMQHERHFLEYFREDSDFMSRPIDFGEEADIYIFERLAIKVARGGRRITPEMEIQRILSQHSSLFLPVFAYDVDTIVMPWVPNAQRMETLDPDDQWILQLSKQLAPIFIQACIEPKDLHQGNVLINDQGIYVIDMSRYIVHNNPDHVPPLDEMIYHVYCSLQK